MFQILLSRRREIERAVCPHNFRVWFGDFEIATDSSAGCVPIQFLASGRPFGVRFFFAALKRVGESVNTENRITEFASISVGLVFTKRQFEVNPFADVFNDERFERCFLLFGRADEFRRDCWPGCFRLDKANRVERKKKRDEQNKFDFHFSPGFLSFTDYTTKRLNAY
jgi:hypothetical protein